MNSNWKISTDEEGSNSGDYRWYEAGASSLNVTNDEEKSPLTSEKSKTDQDLPNSDSIWDAKYFENLPKTSSQISYEKVTLKDVNSKTVEKVDITCDHMFHNSVEFNSDNARDGMHFDDIPQTSSKKTTRPEVNGDVKEFGSFDSWNIRKSFYNHLGTHDNSLISNEKSVDTCGSSYLNDESQISSQKGHETEIVTLNNNKRKSFEEDVIDLTSDCEMDEVDHYFLASKKSSLKAKEQKLELKEMDISFHLKNSSHETENVILKDNKCKSFEEEVIDLTSDCEMDEVDHYFLASKQSNLKAEEQKLGLKEMGVSLHLTNSSSVAGIKTDLFRSLEEERVKHNIGSEKKKLKSISESQTFIDKQVMNDEKDYDFFVNKLPKDFFDFEDEELSNSEKNLIVDTLEKLHKSINNQPERFAAEPNYGIRVSLLPHQKYALGWALWRESQKPSGGILADDMGLGKTFTMIALILYTLLDKKIQDQYSSIYEPPARRKIPDGGTLVIVPASLLSQWVNEISSKVFDGQMSFYLYHGPSRKKEKCIPYFHIVLSTYGTVQKESFNDPLMKINWKRIILDEAHIIRNRKSKQASSIFDLKGDKRWALTGTPVQNRELDLYNILKFLRCEPFDDYDIWKKFIYNKDVTGIQRLNCILKAILLRRTKEELKLEGHLASLKSKTYHDISVSLNEEEYEVYKNVAYFSRTLLLQLIKQKAEKESLFSGDICSVRPHFKVLFEENPFPDHPELRELYSDMMALTEVEPHHILVLMLRLRQICVHPALARSVLDKNELKNDGIESDEPREIPVVDRLHSISLSKTPEISNNIFYRTRWSSKLQAVIKCVMDIFRKTSDKIIIVSQWVKALDIIKEYLTEKDIDIVEFNGTILMKKRPEIISVFNEEAFGPRVMLLSLMAGGTGLNLMGANHLLLVDCHWNPQVEAQAFDRIYRVGQRKEVHIYKFVCTNTIEERIVELQKQKLELSEGVLNGTIITSRTKLTLNDLKMLFNVK